MENPQHMELFQMYYLPKLELMYSLMGTFLLKMLDLEIKNSLLMCLPLLLKNFKQEVKLITYPKLEKKFPSFSLTVEPGKVEKEKSLGIMGANALGKTT